MKKIILAVFLIAGAAVSVNAQDSTKHHKKMMSDTSMHHKKMMSDTSMHHNKMKMGKMKKDSTK
ncbi:MAG: hypothetical protein ABJB86_02560 [Bacteroidota bacterium]